MIGHAHHHLADDRLLEGYVTERGGSKMDPPIAEHLADCPDCAARYEELVGFMSALRAEADAETNAVFTPERLRQQQQQIERRIEHITHPARVISFPGRLVTRRMRGAAARLPVRWASAAAAAGLFIGLGVGSFVDRKPRPAIANAPARVVAPAAVSLSAPPRLSDDEFLSELDLALGGPRNQELLPFDELTPRVQEIRR